MNKKELLRLIDLTENEYNIEPKENNDKKFLKKRSFIRKVLSKIKWYVLRSLHYIKILITGQFVKILKIKIYNSKANRIKRGKKLLKKIFPSDEILEKEKHTIFKDKIKISIIVPLFNTPEEFLREMIESVLKQTYSDFELCLADGSDKEHDFVGKIVKEYQNKDKRIKYKKLLKNEGISENTNSCIAMAKGEYLALFDHDDILHPEVLYYCMKEIEEHNADFIYTDEATFNSPNLYDIRDIQYKPDFAREDLLSLNYICHFLVFDRNLLNGQKLYDSNYDGSQDHEMILRLSSIAKNIRHIPKILYFWRIHPLSVASNISAKSYAISAGKRAVIDFEKKKNRNVKIKSTVLCATHYRLFYELKNNLVDIVIMNRVIDNSARVSKQEKHVVAYEDKFMSAGEKNLKDEIINNTDYKYVKFHYIDIRNGFKTEISRIKDSLNGKYVLFLDENDKILKRNQLDFLVMYIQKEEVGAVAGRGINSFGQMTENGYLKSVVEDNPVFPIDRGVMFNAAGNIARNYYAHNVSIISLNGMMIKKDILFNEIELDDKLRTYRLLGADICIQLLKLNKEVVINPYALLLIENIEKNNEEEMNYFKQKYKEELEKQDSYYNPNYSKKGNWEILYE